MLISTLDEVEHRHLAPYFEPLVPVMNLTISRDLYIYIPVLPGVRQLSFRGHIAGLLFVS